MGKGVGSIYAWVLIMLFISHESYAYTKLCYTTYAYADSEKFPTAHAKEGGMKPFGDKNPHYKFQCSQGNTHCYVALERKDLKKIKTDLRGYDNNEVITDSLIAHYKKTHKAKQSIVGWVLEDFKTSNSTITIGQILSALNL